MQPFFFDLQIDEAVTIATNLGKKDSVFEEQKCLLQDKAFLFKAIDAFAPYKAEPEKP